MNKYGDISPMVAATATKKLLERGQHIVMLERFGQIDPQPKNSTDTRKFRRYHSLARATAPLAEGVTPAGQRMTFTDYTATLEEYGDWVQLTDKVADLHSDPVLNEAMKLCGENAAETIEVIRHRILTAGSNVAYANGVASRALVTSGPLKVDLRKIVRLFKRHKGMKITEIVQGSTKVGTKPIEASYFALAHSDLTPDIRDIPGFTHVSQYGDSMKAIPGEIGNVEDIRFIESPLFEPVLAAGVSGSTYLTNCGTGTGNADVYPILVVAKNAYGIVPLAGSRAVEIGVVNPGSKTKDDPLGQRGFVSWKTWQAAVILNELWMCRYEVAARQSPANS